MGPELESIRVHIRNDSLTRPALLTLETVATDVDRQLVAAKTRFAWIRPVSTSPRELRAAAGSCLWIPSPASMSRLYVPTERRSTSHGLRRVVRAPLVARPGDAAPDTVARCDVRTAHGVGRCTFTPSGAGTVHNHALSP